MSLCIMCIYVCAVDERMPFLVACHITSFVIALYNVTVLVAE